MAKSQRGQRARDAAPRKFKKKTSPRCREVEYVDYKDVDLLSRFMSDRGKIRGQRINGNDVQQQQVANAIKIAREMGLLPYARRVASASAVVHRVTLYAHVMTTTQSRTMRPKSMRRKTTR